MAETTKIQWTTHTFNPWRGCTKVSPGCANCYAETLSGRNPKVLGVWGPNGTRVVASETMWKEPVKWNKAAQAAGERRRVFCASLADAFEAWDGRMSAASGVELWKDKQSKCWEEAEDEKDYAYHHEPVTMQDVRNRLFALIDATPNLDWLLLTKRPENIYRMMPAMPSDIHGKNWFRPNVWLGVSVERQEEADKRIPILLQTPAAVRFLSCEPLLSAIDLSEWLQFQGPTWRYSDDDDSSGQPGIDWVIIGGESGPNARQCHVEWVRDLVKQCRDAGVKCFVKQLGRVVLTGRSSIDKPSLATQAIMLKDSHGGDPAEWPEDLRIREFPR